ncbi:MAG: hypothetical protein R3B93_23780 [Bacteroidia bacterium]
MDEKTGIQAIERFSQPAPESKGDINGSNMNTSVHGTTTLIAANNVENGQWINYHLGGLLVMKQICTVYQQKPSMDYPKWIKSVILADQLNIHLSETLVRWQPKENSTNMIWESREKRASSNPKDRENSSWKIQITESDLSLLPSTAHGSIPLKMASLKCKGISFAMEVFLLSRNSNPKLQHTSIFITG